MCLSGALKYEGLLSATAVIFYNFHSLKILLHFNEFNSKVGSAGFATTAHCDHPQSVFLLS